MDFIREIDGAIQSGFDEFNAFIQQKIAKNADFLEQSFWMAKDAAQMTVLNYLIHLYPTLEESNTRALEAAALTQMIDQVLKLSTDKNAGEPLHQAIASGKIQLTLHILNSTEEPRTQVDTAKKTVTHHLQKADKKTKTASGIKGFDINKRDQAGRTILSLAIASKRVDLLIAVLNKAPNVHAPTLMSASRIPFQPIHQAVVLDFADGVGLLARQGAQLANPCGIAQDTPLLLAAYLCKTDSLEALLKQPSEQLVFEAERLSLSGGKIIKKTAIELLCDHINEGTNKEQALRGVGILLCRGAEPPRSKVLCDLLSTHRITLLKAIHDYLADKPELVEAFVNRCHLSESSLHHIVYAHHSWGNAIRRLFGKPSDAAFIIEDLLVRKYPSTTKLPIGALSTGEAENLSEEKDPVKLYALFVARYMDAYNGQVLSNTWSAMRLMIAEGQCDWEKVKKYVLDNPKTRSAIIYNEMVKPMPIIHEHIKDEEDTSSSLNLSA